MTYIRIRFQKRGGHYHCRLFTAQNYDGTFANCGELVFDEREFTDVRDKLSRCEWIDDERQRMHDEGVRDGLHPPVPPKHRPVA